MTGPLVSVVVPAYNHGRFIAEAVESILSQDYPRIEVIVVDDGSSDDTEAVLAPYRARIACESQRNAGQSAALNRGWRASRGEILAYLSADDALRPRAVRTAVEALAARPDAALVYGNFELMDDSSRSYRVVTVDHCDLPGMIAQFTTLAGPGAFFRREAFERAGEWDVKLRQNPDADFLFRLGLQGTFVHVPHVMAAFRVHVGSQTYQAPSLDRAEEPLTIVRRFFARPDLPDAVRKRRRASFASAHALAARQHLRAGRWAAFLRHAGAAVREHPPTVASMRTARLWGGALRATYGRARR